MSKYSLILLSLLVAKVVGLPWHDSVEHRKASAPSMSSYWRGAAQENSEIEPMCKSAISLSLSEDLSTYVQVCKDSSSYGVCYFSTMFLCCSGAVIDSIIVEPENIVHLGGIMVNMTLRTKVLGSSLTKQDMCLYFGDKHEKIDICETNHNCFPRKSCEFPKQVCRNNTVEGTTCTVMGCTCKTGYLGPDCCECDPTNNFFKAEEGSCKRLCSRKCKNPSTNGECIECRPGYQGPTCCECKPDFVEIDGNCQMVECIDGEDVIFLLDNALASDNYHLWTASYLLEFIMATLLQESKDLKISVALFASDKNQKELFNYTNLESLSHRDQCLDIAQNIENKVYLNKPKRTFSYVTLSRINEAQLVRSGARPTTVITLIGTTSDDDISYVVEEIQKSTSAIARRRTRPVRYFSVAIPNPSTGALNTKFEKEIIALANGERNQVSYGSNWQELFTNLTSNLHDQQILCDRQKTSILEFLNKASTKTLLDGYIDCVYFRNIVADENNACVRRTNQNKELDFSGICNITKSTSVESKLIDDLWKLLDRLNWRKVDKTRNEQTP